MRATERLTKEHRSIIRGLDLLDIYADRVRKGEPVEADTGRALVDFIRRFADRLHHGKEEDMLFPAMEEAGLPRDGGPVAVMLMEHDEGRSLVGEMAGALDDGLGSAGDQFVRAAAGFSSLLRQHIDKEDNILYRIADQHIAPDRADDLARRCQEHDEVTHKDEYLACLRSLEEIAGKLT